MLNTTSYKVDMSNDCLRNLVERFNWDYKNADMRIIDCAISKLDNNNGSVYNANIKANAYKSFYASYYPLDYYDTESEAIKEAFEKLVVSINTGSRHITAY
jgi:hypothetical protein